MLFKRSKKQKASVPILQLKVQHILRETPDALRVIFEAPSTDFAYHAGQFLTFILQIDGKERRRCYSLCSCPELGENPAVVIKRVGKGLVSNDLHKILKIGSTLATLPPMGQFSLSEQHRTAKKIVLIAGGSGITPLFSIAQSLLHTTQAQVFLLYGNRNEQSIILKHSIDELLTSHRKRFTVFHLLENPSENTPDKGLLHEHMLHDRISAWGIAAPQEAFYFVCGPTEMMTIAIKALSTLHVTPEHIKKESFVAGITSPADTIMSPQDTPSYQVTIFLDGQTHSLTVPYGRTILDCGIEEDLGLPFSCQNGICATCRGKLLKGKVHMQSDEALSPEEIAQGYILCCQAQPLENEVEILIE